MFFVSLYARQFIHNYRVSTGRCIGEISKPQDRHYRPLNLSAWKNRLISPPQPVLATDNPVYDFIGTGHAPKRRFSLLVQAASAGVAWRSAPCVYDFSQRAGLHNRLKCFGTLFEQARGNSVREATLSRSCCAALRGIWASHDDNQRKDLCIPLI